LTCKKELEMLCLYQQVFFFTVILW
jgi:hypothetical protein